MFANELTKIKESEDKADQLQKKAKTDSKQALEDANNKATKILEDAQILAKDTYGNLIQEGQKQSDKEYDEFLATAKEECDKMIEKAKKNENKAVELIAERIVKSSVNN